MDEHLLDVLARRLADRLRCDHEALCLQLMRLLACGQPVSRKRLAAVLQMSQEDVNEALTHLADAEFDEAGNIIGWGLSLVPTSHRFHLNDRLLYTWCALDALIYPALLKQRVQVESSCPVTGASVTLSITPNGIENLTPASAVVSLVIPASRAACECDRAAFCNRGHFFCSRGAASVWQVTHQDALILTVQDAYQLGQLIAIYRYERGISSE